MQRHKTLALLGTSLFLSACVSGEGSPTAAPTPFAECQVPSRSSIGQPYTQALAEQLRTAASARQVRRLEPIAVTTREFFADRLNIVVDARDRVADLHCG